MVTLDENNNEITDLDLSKGYLKTDSKVIHHDAVKAVTEKSHIEVVAQYPNGGADIERIIDVPGVIAKDAYDETVQICRYIKYTDEELKKIQDEKVKPTPLDRISAMESAVEELAKMVSAGQG
jgi:hypothetical protein